MEPRETGEPTTQSSQVTTGVETGDSYTLPREDEAPTVEIMRPPKRDFVISRLLSRQAVMTRVRPWMPRVSGQRFVMGLAVVALVIVVLGVVLVPNLPPRVQLTVIQQDNIVLRVSTSGTLQSAIYDANFIGNGGKIVEIDVAVGQHVTAGQTLAKLDTTLLQDAVREAQAVVTTAQTRLSNAQTNQSRTQAQTDAELNAAFSKEQADLRQCGINTSCQQAARDAYAAAQAKAANDNAAAQAQVSDAQSQLTGAQAKLQTAQDTLSGATLVAPHTGTIAAVNSSVGSVVGGSGSAGSTGGIPLIRIADLNALQVTADVSVADVNTVAKGQTASITVPSAGRKVFPGTVSTVSPLGKVVDGTLRYPVTVDVDTTAMQSSQLLPGMAANAIITTQERIGVLVIPVEAVAFARAAADRTHGGFLTKTQVETALKSGRQLLLEAQDGGKDTSQALIAYVVERTNDAWVVKPVLLGVTDGHVYEVLAGLTKSDKVATGERNALGFTIGPIAPTPTPMPVPR